MQKNMMNDAVMQRRSKAGAGWLWMLSRLAVWLWEEKMMHVAGIFLLYLLASYQQGS